MNALYICNTKQIFSLPFVQCQRQSHLVTVSIAKQLTSMSGDASIFTITTSLVILNVMIKADPVYGNVCTSLNGMKV